MLRKILSLCLTTLLVAVSAGCINKGSHSGDDSPSTAPETRDGSETGDNEDADQPNSPPEQPPLPEESPGALGVYHFQTEEVDITDSRITYARLVIPWGAVEPEEGRFDWDAQSLVKIDQALAKSIRIVPVIRTVGADWALKTPFTASSSPPKDMQDVPDETYAYSITYYTFIREIARRYMGKFQIVVIENECVAENFWRGSMDEYLRLVATAAKGFKDVDPDVRVSDSGIPSTVWGMLMTKELLDQGKEEEALSFYTSFFSESFVRQVSSIEELRTELEKESTSDIIEKAQYILDHFNGVVDIINFHYYEPAEMLPDVISFIRDKTGGVPLISNELGSRVRLDEQDREEKAAGDMVRKFVLAHALQLDAAMWFPFTNDRHNIVGLLDANKGKIELTMNAFDTAMRFLNRAPLSYNDLSKGNVQHHSFLFSSGRVDVVWCSSEMNVERLQQARYYDLAGTEIGGNNITITSSPLYIVYPQ